MTIVKTKWVSGTIFDSEVDGFKLRMDIPESTNQGPRPKPLLLVALSGCSGMDVTALLTKMRVTGYALNIQLEADSTEEHPKVYHTIRMKYMFKGDNLSLDKVMKAVEMSRDRYCGVNAMLKKAINIHIYIYFNETEVWHD